MKGKIDKSLKLTAEGERVVNMLVAKYGMTRDNAIRLVQDGKVPLAMAFLMMR